MPEYAVSREARWLSEAWPTLTQYEGKWIAVWGHGVWGSDRDLEALGRRAREEGFDPLYAFVWFDRVA